MNKATNKAMSNQLSLISLQSAQSSVSVQQRLIMYPDELYRVPANYDKLRVVAGTAFVTQAARDLVVDAGHEVALSNTGDVALVSTLRNNPLIIELFTGRSTNT